MDPYRFEPVHTTKNLRSTQSRYGLFLIMCIFVMCALCMGGALFYVKNLNEPPQSFPINTDVRIEEGMTVGTIADHLAESHIIQSSFLFYSLFIIFHEHEFIQAGTYRFPQSFTSSELANILIRAEYQSPTQSITFPEGFTTKNFLEFLPEAYQSADTTAIQQYEGFLFPDTYFITPEYTFEEIVALQQQTYEEKISPLRPAIEATGLSEHDVITLASIVEREANDETSMRTVSGILQNRLAEGIPLQVDAVFEYLLGKTSAELTLDDLKLDSPYNTYTNTGLPPGPIANPGLAAITAVLDPIASDYLYYLTGNDGHFYYAKTFEEHKRNKERYLR